MPKQRVEAAWWEGQWAPRPVYGKKYNLSSQHLLMRGGIKIAVDVYLPRGMSRDDKVPTILCQTRYQRRTRYNHPYSIIFNLRDPPGSGTRRLMSQG